MHGNLNMSAMKNYIFKPFLYFTVFLLLSCSQDSLDIGTSFEGTGTSGSLAKFTIVKDHLYIINEENLNTLDISNRTLIERTSKKIGSDVETIFPYDTLLLFGTSTGMLIYDIGNTPHSPNFISQTSHFYSCDPVVAKDTFAYVTLNNGSSRCWRSNSELQVYNISDIYNPELISTINMDTPKGLGVNENYLIVADDGIKLYSTLEKDLLIELDHLTNINTHDVIPLDKSWIIVGTDGLKQFIIENEKLVQISEVAQYEN